MEKVSPSDIQTVAEVLVAVTRLNRSQYPLARSVVLLHDSQLAIENTYSLFNWNILSGASVVSRTDERRFAASYFQSSTIDVFLPRSFSEIVVDEVDHLINDFQRRIDLRVLLCSRLLLFKSLNMARDDIKEVDSGDLVAAIGVPEQIATCCSVR